MTLAVMSNPGLSLAVLGNPGRGYFRIHNGHKTASTKGTTMARHFRRRFNPSIAMITTPVTSIPANLKSILTGSIKDKAIKGAAAVGGATVALAGGAIVAKQVSRFVPAAALNLPVVGMFVPRLVGGGSALLVASVVAKFAPLKPDQKKALLAGGALVAVLEVVKPGLSGSLLAKIPFVGKLVGNTPVSGLGAYVEASSYQGIGTYVEAPGYQGIGTYVEAPGYQGIGEHGDNMVAGYVSAPSYQGVGSIDGLVGSNMPSFLDVGTPSYEASANS